jgi:hypothetical protein
MAALKGINKPRTSWDKLFDAKSGFVEYFFPIFGFVKKNTFQQKQSMK